MMMLPLLVILVLIVVVVLQGGAEKRALAAVSKIPLYMMVHEKWNIYILHKIFPPLWFCLHKSPKFVSLFTY